MLVKICGLTNAEDAHFAAEAGADFLGFVDHPASPRHCSDISSAVKGNEPQSVLVTVGHDPIKIMTAAHSFGIKRIQPHVPVAFRKEVLEVLRVHGFWVLLPWADEPDQPELTADLYLWEPSPTRTGVAGGSGQTHAMAHPPPGPFLLAGGLDGSNVCLRLAMVPEGVRAQAKGADAASRLECAPGLKNLAAVRLFVEELKRLKDVESAESAVNKMKNRFSLSTCFGTQGLGGCYAPETLMQPLLDLEAAFLSAMDDPGFQGRLRSELNTFVGRPTALTFAPRMAARVGLQGLWLKREDLTHTGAHKINNALAQALLALRMGKAEIIAETGAGQHGVATAAACARLGLKCTVYMGVTDMARQAPNVARMRLFGAEVVGVETGQGTLKEAVNEALRAWAGRCDKAHYILGSALGPHPFPTMVRTFQTIIGEEARAQVLETEGRLPEAVMACAGGGSNGLGLLMSFLDDPVRRIAVEAGGHGEALGEHAARASGGRIGVLHGCKTLLLQDAEGRTAETASISAGLDYPALGPELAALALDERVEVRRTSDDEALAAAQLLCETEGILPALESSHALAQLASLAKEGVRTVLVGLSGRGDKDLSTYQTRLGLNGGFR